MIFADHVISTKTTAATKFIPISAKIFKRHPLHQAVTARLHFPEPCLLTMPHYVTQGWLLFLSQTSPKTQTTFTPQTSHQKAEVTEGCELQNLEN
ncbi:unnamed protein product [Heligmosomoides polygyrus]|uniref:Ovule protein n=1 Tax=Heligmosomoides polygyrus TaxID=6339 RepID=A0A183G5L6_HELPZ|nr:unnamed protein product [Heligmosomoides polygyrus]